MTKSKIDNCLNDFVDSIKDPIQWIDAIGLNFYMAGKLDQNIPVEWGRERMKAFIKALKQSRIKK